MISKNISAKKIISLAVIFIIVLLSSTLSETSFSSTEPINKGKKSFLWKVEHKQAIVYLFGSIHLADKNFYPLAKNIDKAFSKASTLVVEVNMSASDHKQMQAEILRRGTYLNGDTIRSHVNQKTFDLLSNFCNAWNIPIDSVIMLKPGMLAMTLSATYFSKLGYTAKYGIDNYFLNKAQNNKKILELETMQEQLDLLLDETNDELFLSQTLSSLNKLGNELNELINTWKNGDAETMNRLIIVEPLNESPEQLPIYQKLFFSRNKKMSAKIVRYLNTNEVYFVVVGAGHLVGDKGIINILRLKNYVVDQL